MHVVEIYFGLTQIFVNWSAFFTVVEGISTEIVCFLADLFSGVMKIHDDFQLSTIAAKKGINVICITIGYKNLLERYIYMNNSNIMRNYNLLTIA